MNAVADVVGEEVSRKLVKQVVETLVAVGHKELKKNGLFVLPGFAKFIVVKKPARPARKGINGTSARYENYLQVHPHDEFRDVEPLGQIDWDDGECVAEDTHQVRLRGRPVLVPQRGDYGPLGIELVEPGRVQVFELCRYLAAVVREDVLAAPSERRVSVRPEMTQLMQLEEWRHPNVVVGELPSGSRTFQQLANVLETGDVRLYEPESPNTHWQNWPDGGSLFDRDLQVVPTRKVGLGLPQLVRELGLEGRRLGFLRGGVGRGH